MVAHPRENAARLAAGALADDSAIATGGMRTGGGY
jgi:hypothetical protein